MSPHPVQPVAPGQPMRFLGSPDTDVGLIASAALAVVLTAVAYAALWSMRDAAVAAMFFQKSALIFWVPPVEVYLTSWGLSVLILKARLRRKQARFLRSPALLDLPERITLEDASTILHRLDESEPRWPESLLLHRIGRLLAHFRATQDRSEIAALSAAQSDIDGTTLRSSYTMVKVFVWAIPILGFIGTVIGLQEAIRGFAGLSNVDRLQEQLAPITGGLGGAFQATLIALAFSLLLMFPSSASEKAEWRFLNLIDDFCNDQILRRLYLATPASGKDPLDEERLKALARAVASELADSITLKIPKLTEALYAELFSKERVQALVAELYRNVLVEAGRVIQGALTAQATGVKTLTEAIQEETKQRAGALQAQTEIMHAMTGSQSALRECAESLQAARDGISEVVRHVDAQRELAAVHAALQRVSQLIGDSRLSGKAIAAADGHNNRG